MKTVIGGWLARRRIAWLKAGAALDEKGLRAVRVMRWWAPASGVLSLVIAGTDDRPLTIAFFGSVALAALLFVTPACFTVLEGHRRRAEIDAHDAESLVPDLRLMALALLFVAAYVLAVPVLDWFGVLTVR